MPSRLTPRPATFRRLPLPVADPPFDDELGTVPAMPRQPRERGDRQLSGAGALQGALALSVTPAGRAPASPRPGEEDLEGLPALRPEPAGPPPDPRRWCPWFAQALVEVLYGRRPARQLARWTSEDVYTALARRLTRQTGLSSTATPAVRSLRLCQVNEQVIEAGVVIQAGDRAGALAIRIEFRERRWLCTALDIP